MADLEPGFAWDSREMQHSGDECRDTTTTWTLIAVAPRTHAALSSGTTRAVARILFVLRAFLFHGSGAGGIWAVLTSQRGQLPPNKKESGEPESKKKQNPNIFSMFIV